MAESFIDSGFGWVGQIPSTWAVNKNKYVFINSKKLVGKNWESTQLLSLTKNGVKEKDINEGGGKQPDSFSTYQYVKKSDLVMCLFDLDQSAVFSGISKYDGMISPAYKLLKCNEAINPEYASYWFDFVFDGRKFKTYSKNIRYTLDYDEFGKLPILTPPLEEQKRIADFLDEKCAEIDKLSEDIQKQIEILGDYKRSVIARVVTRGIAKNVQTKECALEWISSIASDFEQVPIRYLFNENRKKNTDGSVKNALKFTYGKIVPKDSFNQDVDNYVTDTIKNYTVVKPGDVMINCLNLNYDFVSQRIGLVKNNGVITSAYLSIRAIDKNKVLPAFANYEFKMFDSFKAFHNMGSGVRKTLDFSELGKKYFILPNIDVQKNIVVFLDKKCAEIDDSINTKLEQLDKLTTYKKSIIYEYVTGKKRVKGALWQKH